MRNVMLKSLFLVLCVTLLSVNGYGQEVMRHLPGNITIAEKGYIGFQLETEKSYINGNNGEDYAQVLFQLPGLLSAQFVKTYNSVIIAFLWDNAQEHKGYYLFLTELPGPDQFYFQIAWDGAQGRSELYVNGRSVRRESGMYDRPWAFKGQSDSLYISEGEIHVKDVEVLAEFVGQKELGNKVPERFRNKSIDPFVVKPLKAKDKPNKGQLLYAASFEDGNDFANWVIEGPATSGFEDKSLVMKSTIPNPPDGEMGHFNFWCPQAFPERFIAEWEFKPVSPHGVCHFFFAANGEGGEDMFSETLPKRDGVFNQYHSGALQGYFVIYYSNWSLLRTTNFAATSLQKLHPYALISQGALGIIPDKHEFQKAMLIKDNGHIQLIINGKLCLDATDPGNDKWGEVPGKGYIGFRQMAETVAAYRNFKVWELK